MSFLSWHIICITLLTDTCHHRHNHQHSSDNCIHITISTGTDTLLSSSALYWCIIIILETLTHHYHQYHHFWQWHIIIIIIIVLLTETHHQFYSSDSQFVSYWALNITTCWHWNREGTSHGRRLYNFCKRKRKWLVSNKLTFHQKMWVFLSEHFSVSMDFHLHHGRKRIRQLWSPVDSETTGVCQWIGTASSPVNE